MVAAAVVCFYSSAYITNTCMTPTSLGQKEDNHNEIGWLHGTVQLNTVRPLVLADRDLE